MSVMTGVRRGTKTLGEFLWPSRAEDRSIPVLDGGLSPNDALDGFSQIWQSAQEPDDIAAVGGRLVVSSGSSLELIDPSGRHEAAVLELPERVGALAAGGSALLYAVTIDGPIYEVTVAADALQVSAELPGGLACPTAAVFDNGSLLVAVGSTTHAPDEWSRDLMTKGRTGQVIEVAVPSGTQRVIADNLAWAGGVVATAGGSLLVSETWRHRISRIDRATGATTQLTRPLAGYPTRITASTGDQVLVAFLSLRTHLVEFVLREDEFREEMMRTIAPEFWIAPAHGTTGERWEPLQIGSIKHLNVTKPWAPPRAYGLVAAMDAGGDFLTSWHARVGSPRSGVTGVALLDGHPAVVSRGSRSVLIEEGVEQR